ncbi:sensor histidine kinase [Cumulibacter soli]|uniref:sensor histidine kinase n=1 Tax=Cumulibacter soli TaxID=2546344 RepID=UPI001ABB301C|nr:sensor histidine kinase [Cumulibacter soli]
MTESAQGSRPRHAEDREHERRQLGWLLGSVWVLFLVYPLLSSLTADVSWGLRILAAVLTVGFGAFYVRTMWWMEGDALPPTGRAALRLLALVLVVLATSAIIGIEALGFSPFIVSYAVFAFSRALSVAVFALVLAATIIIPVAAREFDQWWFMTMIVVLVGVTTGAVRIITERAAVGELAKEQLAVVAERERVARDVHDVLGHSLTVVIVKAELAERLVRIDPERAERELSEITSLSREALAEVRATVGGLRVARLGDELDTARHALTTAGIEADIPDTPDAVDPRYRIIFAWVLREAITNVVRHSRASSCTVELTERRIRVIDDGTGRHTANEGNGLRGIRERVEAAAGRFSILPASTGAGIELKVEM